MIACERKKGGKLKFAKCQGVLALVLTWQACRLLKFVCLQATRDSVGTHSSVRSEKEGEQLSFSREYILV